MTRDKYDYTDRFEDIAHAYNAAVVYDPAYAGHWMQLAEHSIKRAQVLGSLYEIHVVSEPEPYATPEDMFADLNEGHFMVSRANSEHPVWDTFANVAFRIVHDIDGHYVAHNMGREAGFDWKGEAQACRLHFELLAADGALDARTALFTECLGQTGAAIYNGRFGIQKVAALPIGL